MIASEKSHQNLSDYIQFLFKNRFEANKKQIISSKKMRNSGNCVYNYAHSFLGDDFHSNALYWYIKIHMERVKMITLLCKIQSSFRKYEEIFSEFDLASILMRSV